MFDSRRFAFKECWLNGSWYHHPESGKEWSNYTDCVDFEDLKVSKYLFIRHFSWLIQDYFIKIQFYIQKTDYSLISAHLLRGEIINLRRTTVCLRQ